jgi:dihydrolipoamide dehydrogenase
MSQRHFDLIVFGGGNAITTAIECGKAGMKVALIERGPLGGTCPHRGCIPSKLLIGFADAAESVRQAVKFGFETTINIPDPDRILIDTFEFTRKYDSILQDALGENITLFRGTGVLTGNYSLSVNGAEISADKVVLATGSRPKRPNFEGPYWTSDDVFTLKKMPRSITIVGGVISLVSWAISFPESASKPRKRFAGISCWSAKTRKSKLSFSEVIPVEFRSNSKRW